MSNEHSSPESGQSEASADVPRDPRSVLRRLQEVSSTFRDCKPLALRIDKTIFERFPGWDRKLVRIAMHQHTASTRYLKAVEKSTARFDFDGNEAGELAEEHRQHAAQTLKERFAEQAKRKREQAREEQAKQRAEEKDRQRVEKLQALVGKFSRNS